MRLRPGAVWTVPEALIGALLIFCVVLDGANVFARYVLLSPIIAAEEILGYVLVWGVFIGAILVTRQGDHLRMDLLAAVLPPKPRLALRTLESVLTLMVCGLIAYKCIQAAVLIGKLGERSMVLGIPVVVLFVALPMGFALMAGVAAWTFWLRYKALA